MTETIFQVVEVVAVTVKLTQQGEKRRSELLIQGRCLGCERQLVPGKRGDEVRCGQCNSCYAATQRNIKARRVTQNELVREGKLLKPTKGGRKPTNPYTKSLSERG